MKGAEAVLKKGTLLGIPVVEKLRMKKKYRATALDETVRRGRTKREARLLSRAKEAGVLCPAVLCVGEFSITMKYMKGKMLYGELKKRSIRGAELRHAAGVLAALHSVDVVHGDYTPANLMLTKQGMAVIDFGLGAVSNDAEDKATDVVTMKKALGRNEGGKFVREYAKRGRREVVRMVSEIEGRARYMERG